MPRKPAISHDKLLHILLATENVVHEDGSIPGPSHEVWKTISSKLDYILKPNYVYQQVKENRHDVFNKLLEHHNIKIESNCKLKTSEEIEYKNDSSPSSTTSTPLEGEIKPKKTFQVHIKQIDWETLKPIKTKYRRKERGTLREMTVLPPYKWETILMDLLWDQHKLPCPYSFLYSKVSTDRSVREQYITIKATCKECKAEAEGKIFCEPQEGEGVILHWRCEDTRNVVHNRKRWLTGDKRSEISQKLFRRSAHVFRCEMANQLMDEKDVESPNLFTESVLRKAKQEGSDLNYNIVHGPDAVICLSLMKHTYPHAGSIHNIGLDKFFVHYNSQSQMEIYTSIARKTYTSISIDATGSLVHKILRQNGPSQHIFLYEVVLKTDGHDIPILQMLSEAQDGNSILFWLNEWLRSGAPIPNEVNIDDSKAIKSAVSRCFGHSVNIADYAQKCFDVVSGKDVRLPPCYIRLDLAHFLKSAADWDLWKDKLARRLKEFYMHCIGLLIVCTSLVDFKTVLYHILTLSLAAEEVSVDDNNVTESSLSFIRDRIRGRSVLSNFVDQILGSNEDDELDFFTEDLNTKDEDDTCNSISQWVKSIVDMVQKMIDKNQGHKLNPYFLPDFSHKVIKLSHNFPIWSSVMNYRFKSPNLTSSSSNVENEFNNIKHRILKGETKPLHVHKMVDIHLNYLYGICKISLAKPAHATEENTVPKSGNLKENHTSTMVKSNYPPLSNNILERSDKNQSQESDEVNEEQDRFETSDLNENHTSTMVKSNYPPLNNNILERSDKNQSQESDEVNEEQDRFETSDLNSFENWRNLGVDKTRKIKISKYTHANEEFETAVSGKSLTTPKKPLLRNGNYEPFIFIQNKKVGVKNTCAFDALVTVIAQGYIQVETYRNLIDQSENLLLKTALSLAITGSGKETYKCRAIALTSIFQPQSQLPKLQIINRGKIFPTYQYDTWSSALTLLTELLPDVESVKTVSICSTPSCKGNASSLHTIIDTNSHILLKEGMNSLPKAISYTFDHTLRDDTKVHEHDEVPSVIIGNCKYRCGGQISTNIEGMQHLFIDTSFICQEIPMLKDALFNRPHTLEEIPVHLKLTSKNYLLIGIVAYRPNHFVAYVRKHTTGSWNLYDDLKHQVMNVPATEQMVPHLLYYVFVDRKR